MKTIKALEKSFYSFRDKSLQKALRSGRFGPGRAGVTAQTNPPDQNIPRGYSGLAHFIPRGLNQASLEYTPPAQINPPIEIAEKITFIIEKTHIMK